MSRQLVRVLWAGLLGGVLAGGGDALATMSRAVIAPSWENVPRLLALGCALGAALGLGLALLAWVLSWVVAPVAERLPRVSSAGLVAMLMSAPLAVTDAFALFAGAKASRLPGHRAISVALVVLALALMAVAGTLWQRLLGTLKGARGRAIWGAAAGLLLVAVGTAHANRVVLPRLYSWFHASLGLLSVAACVLAGRVVLAGREERSPARVRGGVLALFAGVLALTVLGVAGLSALGASQSLRFFAYEKTQVTSLVLRVLPSWHARRAGAGPAREELITNVGRLPEGPHRPGADVVLITVDAARADHIGAYGYDRPTTPNIDALARRSVRFERAYAQAPHTSFSIASLMIGKYYSTVARLAPHSQHDTLAWTLRRYGWKTAAFFPPAVFFVDAQKMTAFETSNFDFEYVKYEYLDADQRVAQIEDFFRKEHPRKVFLWLHLFEPHEPYLAHPGHDFGDRDVDRYDSELAYCDAVVGRVISYVQATRPNAIIVVAADHGEEFDEHGGRYHGTALYDEQVRVPLIVHVPGVPAHVVPGPVQLIDVAATVLSLIDVLAPARMQGTDLGPWLSMPPAPSERLPPAFAELDDKRMVVKGQEKLMCDLAKDYCAYFDLATDPHEQHDLAEARPQRTAELRQWLDGWLDEQARLESNRLAGGESSAGQGGQLLERGRLGDAEAASGLANLLQSQAPLQERRMAARLLVEALPARPETRAVLAAAMAGADDGEIRDWAAVASVRLGDVSARVRALAMVERADSERHLRLRAALALAETGAGAGVKVLGEALDECSADEALCKTIIAALGKLRNPAAVPALLAHLPDVLTRLEVVQALGEIGDVSGEPALVEILKTNEYVPVRVAAAHALARVGGARALLALKWSARNDKEPRVAEAARAALSELRGGR